jgi:predicted Zn-dependent protease
MGLIENLEKMLASGTDNALLRFGLGNAYLKEGNSEKAVEHLKRALEHDPGYSAAWKLLGKALTDAERTEEAAGAYEAGIRNAEARGDLQAAKEMRVFLKRLARQPGGA